MHAVLMASVECIKCVHVIETGWEMIALKVNSYFYSFIVDAMLHESILYIIDRNMPIWSSSC